MGLEVIVSQKKYGWRIVGVIIIFIVFGAIIHFSSKYDSDSSQKVSSRKTILQLELNGVILNGKKFLKNLEKYQDEEKIKAIVISIDSPGGAVGPSQEIYSAIKRSKEEFKKPIICSTSGLMASGAYYAASACDKIVVAPGALVGSIGVIMSFANLEKLYDWAKISRYSITSGKFKDSGADYRAMRDDERALFQDLINDVFEQFKQAVAEGRKLKEQVLNEYADGRVFTGKKAVQLGFADKEGTFDDAVKLAAEAAGLGSDYKLFKIPKVKRSIFDLGEEDEKDTINSVAEKSVLSKIFKSESSIAKEITSQFIRPETFNQPMMIMPGYW